MVVPAPSSFWSCSCLLPPLLQLVWVASLISTLIFNLDLGLAVAVVFSLCTLLYRTKQSVNIICERGWISVQCRHIKLRLWQYTNPHVLVIFIHLSATLIWKKLFNLKILTCLALEWYHYFSVSAKPTGLYRYCNCWCKKVMTNQSVAQDAIFCLNSRSSQDT